MADPTGTAGGLGEKAAALGALQEPVRRSLYLHVTAQGGDVSRDDAAAAVGIQRALAAFHLDKLVEVGLLEATYRRLSGRSGPGAGRPAKLYRRSSAEHAVTLPPRRYELVATLLAEAVEEAGSGPIGDSLNEVARRFGRQLGEEAKASLPARAGRDRRSTALVEALEACGYEPRQRKSDVRLTNCPFHALSEGHRNLVCNMNLALVEAAVQACGAGHLDARLVPVPGECCVTISRKAADKA